MHVLLINHLGRFGAIKEQNTLNYDQWSACQMHNLYLQVVLVAILLLPVACDLHAYLTYQMQAVSS